MAGLKCNRKNSPHLTYNAIVMGQDVCGQSLHAERESLFSVSEKFKACCGLFTQGSALFFPMGCEC